MKTEQHAPGSPCWVDLATTDQQAAKSFYRALFGWTYDDQPIDQEGRQLYSMASLDGASVAAIYSQPDDQRQAGIPPHWNIFLAVEDIDATAARVASLGGALLVVPFDVFEAGRMTVLQDPTGATAALWQPRRHVGAGIKYEPGAIAWCELMSTDPAPPPPSTPGSSACRPSATPWRTASTTPS